MRRKQLVLQIPRLTSPINISVDVSCVDRGLEDQLVEALRAALVAIDQARSSGAFEGPPRGEGPLNWVVFMQMSGQLDCHKGEHGAIIFSSRVMVADFIHSPGNHAHIPRGGARQENQVNNILYVLLDPARDCDEVRVIGAKIQSVKADDGSSVHQHIWEVCIPADLLHPTK